MFGEPLPHLLIGPGPLEGMGVELVVFRRGGQHMRDELLPTAPGRSLQVMVLERSDQQLCLVQPGGVGRREAGPPPAPATRPVFPRLPGRMAPGAVLGQEHPPPPPTPRGGGPPPPARVL